LNGQAGFFAFCLGGSALLSSLAGDLSGDLGKIQVEGLLAGQAVDQNFFLVGFFMSFFLVKRGVRMAHPAGAMTGLDG